MQQKIKYKILLLCKIFHGMLMYNTSTTLVNNEHAFFHLKNLSLIVCSVKLSIFPLEEIGTVGL